MSAYLTKSEDKLQPSLFTRLTAVEAELRAMKDMLAELKVNQDELRYDRDEWRWRAERLLADQERGTGWRWRRRVAAALDDAAKLFGSLAELQDKLVATKSGWAELRRDLDEWRSRVERLLMDPCRTRWRRVVGRIG